VAYLAGGDAGDGDGRPSPADLRAFLRDRLPDYMVPSAFVWLSALPRTGSGKVDRGALRPPADAAGAMAAPVPHVPPRTGVEKALAEVWREVLAVERVGAHDDFFELGGHSLLALRLVSRVREKLGIDLPVATLLRAPTVEALARALAEGASAGVRLPLIPLQPLGTEPPLFTLHAGGGHVVVYQALAQLLGPHRPVYALQARGLEDGKAPLDSTEEMAAYYLDAIVRLRPEGPYHLAGWSFGGMLAFEMARQLESAGREVGVVALLDTAAPPEPERVGDTLDHARVLVRIIGDIAGWAASAQIKVDQIRHLAPEAQVDAALTCADTPKRQLAGRKDEILELTRVRRANLRAMVGYEPMPYAGSIAYFRTAGAERRTPPDTALEYWSALALGGTTLVRVPGNHGSILYQPHVNVVAVRLKEAMEGRLVDADAVGAAAEG
jgi:thioesterase domain-containing protein/acyl carrier protein